MTTTTEGPDMRPLLTVAEVGKMMQLSPASIYKRRSVGDPMPPAVRIGSALRWRPADIERFLQDQLETKDRNRAM